MPPLSSKPVLGLTLLAFQVVALLHARSVETRYFCWAPFDQITRYRIEATVGGRALTAEEIEARYHLPQVGRNNHATANLKAHLEDFEKTRGREEPAAIRLTYTVNGSEPRTWTWPR